jgi:osmotically-inducible protein OsmY
MQAIEQALVRSAQTDAAQIAVEVDGNTVILKGTVRAYAEKQEAERVAWSAPGVAAVLNRIEVLLTPGSATVAPSRRLDRERRAEARGSRR